MKAKQTLITVLCLLLIVNSFECLGQSNKILRQTTGLIGSSTSIELVGGFYLVQQSIGQASVIGKKQSPNFEFRQGFLQPYHSVVKYSKTNSLSAIVYPNPFRSELTVEINEAVRSEVNISIFDLMGRQVFVKSYPPMQNIIIPLEGLNTGQYVIKIYLKQKVFTAQIQRL